MKNSISCGLGENVAMSPTAWALDSVWSAVWEVPRFRGSYHSMQHDDAAQLLKIAASCVSALLPYVASKDRKSQLPPYGASRELLVAWLDGTAVGKTLPPPTEDPSGFVRALVRAAFTTGDGDLIEGCTGELFESLLEQHCPNQLEFAGSLLMDPSLSLQAAVDVTLMKLNELVARPPDAGDIAGVAGRLHILHRLQSLYAEAATILELGAVRHQLAANATNEQIRPPELHIEPAFLRRSKSQVAGSVKVHKVKQHVDESKGDVHDLGRTVSDLAQKEITLDETVAELEADLEAVEQARKRARVFGEDLLEDMLALDGLHDLNQKDKSARKASIAGIEELLQDVDSAKSRLCNLYRSVQGKLEAAKERQQIVAPTFFDEVSASTRSGGKEAYVDAPVIRTPTPTEGPRQSTQSSHGGVKRKASDIMVQAPPPTKEAWTRVRLPLRFHSREEDDHYIIWASIPGLDTEELIAELGEDRVTLRIEGLRLPTPQEAAQMQQKITTRLQKLARQSPQHFARLEGGLHHVVTDAYTELGQGEYGRFSETFRLPSDVDVPSIDASYCDGVLRLILPKVAPRRRAVDSSGGMRGGRYVAGLRLGAPGLLTPGSTAPGWRPGLFGGLDNSFWW